MIKFSAELLASPATSSKAPASESSGAVEEASAFSDNLNQALQQLQKPKESTEIPVDQTEVVNDDVDHLISDIVEDLNPEEAEALAEVLVQIEEEGGTEALHSFLTELQTLLKSIQEHLGSGALSDALKFLLTLKPQDFAHLIDPQQNTELKLELLSSLLSKLSESHDAIDLDVLKNSLLNSKEATTSTTQNQNSEIKNPAESLDIVSQKNIESDNISKISSSESSKTTQKASNALELEDLDSTKTEANSETPKSATQTKNSASQDFRVPKTFSTNLLQALQDRLEKADLQLENSPELKKLIHKLQNLIKNLNQNLAKAETLQSQLSTGPLLKTVQIQGAGLHPLAARLQQTQSSSLQVDTSNDLTQDQPTRSVGHRQLLAQAYGQAARGGNFQVGETIQNTTETLLHSTQSQSSADFGSQSNLKLDTQQHGFESSSASMDKASKSTEVIETVRLKHGIEVVEKFVASAKNSLKIWVRQNFSAMQVQLDPPELGQVQLKTALSNGKMVAVITTETAVAREILQAHGDQIKNLLKDLNVDLMDLHIDLKEGQQDREQSKAKNSSDFADFLEDSSEEDQDQNETNDYGLINKVA